MIGWTREVIELANLALARFPDLNQSELKVLVGVTTSEIAYCGPHPDDSDPHNYPEPYNNPDFADFWELERDIRAELIRWLCINRDAAAWVDPRGLRIHAARISGQLDLSFAVVRIPLALLRCRITDAINLQFAQIEFLQLSGSLVPGLAADGIRVRADLNLGDGFRSDGEVSLPGANIGGDLICERGEFVEPDGYALRADGVKVGGGVFLRNGFRAEGKVRLPGADIGVNLECDGGKFVKPDGHALTVDGARLGGGFFLRNGFSAQGEVRLLGADIGESLDCNNGNFVNPHGHALNAANVKVGGNVLLKHGFSAAGEVNLVGADISGNLECEDGKFVKPGGYALNADSAKVVGSVFLRNGFGAEGEVCLLGAGIGGNLDCVRGKFVKLVGDALNAEGAKVGGCVFLCNGFRAEGDVRLVGADIGVSLDCHDGKFVNRDGNALVADRVKVAGSVFLGNGFSAQGEVRLLDVGIGSNLDCDGGEFVKPGGRALSADGLKVGGDVFLRHGLIADGGVRLIGADIGGSLQIMDAKFAIGSRLDLERATIKGGFFWRRLGHNVEAALDLSNASVGPIFDEKDSWPTSGNLNLDGFVYTRIGDGPTYAKSRLEWLARQPADQFTPQPYQQLAKVLHEAGDNVGARRVLIAMENSRRKDGKPKWLSWLWLWVLRATIGYGYRPWYALIWALLFVALGSGIFWRYSALITPSDKATYEEMHLTNGSCTAKTPDYYQSFSPVVYSLDAFLPIISFGQKDRWMPNAHCGNPLNLKPRWAWLAQLTPGWITAGWLTTGWLLRLYLWFHIGLGWLLTTLFVAGLTPIVRSG